MTRGWTPSQDLHGYARALSLDLRGVVPSEAELEAIEAAGAIDESMLDEWLESPGFEEQVILEHREQFWNLLDINLLATRRLNIRSGTYFNNRRARYTRLATQTLQTSRPRSMNSTVPSRARSKSTRTGRSLRATSGSSPSGRPVRR